MYGAQREAIEHRCSYVLGIDIGGTCTDAVLVDMTAGEPVAWAKRLTTHCELGSGVASVVEEVLQSAGVSPGAVSETVLSATLGTDTLLENKGVDVGLFVIGFSQRMEVPAAVARFVPGGHQRDGTEIEPLDIEQLQEHLHHLHGKVGAYAVCAMHGEYNSIHELIAAETIERASSLPVFCAHELKIQAGIRERATAAVLNARLLPVMQQCLAEVRSALASHGVSGAVSVVCGDGGVVPLEEAAKHAAATVASGPAASALFGAAYAGRSGRLIGQSLLDVLVVDVGSTTTDISMVCNGNSSVGVNGMMLGEWPVYMDALEMLTVPVGGESLVQLDPAGGMMLGPARVMPVSMAALYGLCLPSPGEWIAPGLAGRCICAGQELDQARCGDDPMLHLLREQRALPLELLLAELDMTETAFNNRMHVLARERSVFECGFTPMDALHVLEAVNMGDAGTAVSTARKLSGIRGEDAVSFSRNVIEKVEVRIEGAILQYMTRHEGDRNLAEFLSRRDMGSLLEVTVRLAMPIVGIGAAVRFLLPGVAARLGTKTVFPELHAVGGALGAAMAVLQEGSRQRG